MVKSVLIIIFIITFQRVEVTDYQKWSSESESSKDPSHILQHNKIHSAEKENQISEWSLPLDQENLLAEPAQNVENVTVQPYFLMKIQEIAKQNHLKRQKKFKLKPTYYFDFRTFYTPNNRFFSSGSDLASSAEFHYVFS